MASSGSARLLVASNRGPLSFTERDDGAARGEPRRRRAWSPGCPSMGSGDGVVWVCAALSDGDRAAARERRGRPAGPGRARHRRHGGADARHRPGDVPPRLQRDRQLDAVVRPPPALRDPHRAGVRRQLPPRVGVLRGLQPAPSPTRWPRRRAEGAKVLVQDYHLTLAAADAARAAARPADRALLAHAVGAAGLLPAAARRRRPRDAARDARRRPRGLPLAAVGAARSRRAASRCSARTCDDEPTARSTSRTGAPPSSACTRSASTPTALRERAAEARRRVAGCAALRDAARRPAGDRPGRPHRAVARTSCAACWPTASCCGATREWRGKVVHLASRLPEPARPAGVPRVHRAGAAAGGGDRGRVRHRRLAPDRCSTSPTTTRARWPLYRVGDVLLVNPIRDGMNLVAKEVPVLSERGCAVVLSTEAGAADELGADALLVNPFDVSGTADALDRALSMSREERRARTDRLAEVVGAAAPERLAGRPGRRAGLTAGRRAGQPRMPAGPGSVNAPSAWSGPAATRQPPVERRQTSSSSSCRRRSRRPARRRPRGPRDRIEPLSDQPALRVLVAASGSRSRTGRPVESDGRGERLGAGIGRSAPSTRRSTAPQTKRGEAVGTDDTAMQPRGRSVRPGEQPGRLRRSAS